MAINSTVGLIPLIRVLMKGALYVYQFPLCSGPSLFMVLSREDAVSGWRALMGPPDPEEAKQQNPNS